MIDSAGLARDFADAANRQKLRELYSTLQDEAEQREHIEAGDCPTCEGTGFVHTPVDGVWCEMQCPNCPAGDL